MAVLETTSTLNGLFTEVYGRKISNSTYSFWQPGNFSAVVHPLTYEKLRNAVNKLKETNMGTLGDCDKAVKEIPLQRELDHRRYQVQELRASIARKQEELRIANALLTTIKKLAKGGK